MTLVVVLPKTYLRIFLLPSRGIDLSLSMLERTTGYVVYGRGVINQLMAAATLRHKKNPAKAGFFVLPFLYREDQSVYENSIP